MTAADPFIMVGRIPCCGRRPRVSAADIASGDFTRECNSTHEKRRFRGVVETSSLAVRLGRPLFKVSWTEIAPPRQRKAS